MSNSGGSTGITDKPKYGRRAYGRQPLYALGVFVMPIAVGIGAAAASKKWGNHLDISGALTVSIALLAILYVRDFVDFMSGMSRSDPDDKPESPPDEEPLPEEDSPLDTARKVTGFFAFLAISMILIHIVIEPATGSTADEIKEAVRTAAIALTVLAFTAWMLFPMTRGLARSPAPEVKHSTRLSAAVIDLIVPVAVVVALWHRFGSWFVDWRTAALTIFVPVFIWQLLLMHTDAASAKRWQEARIVRASEMERGCLTSPGWLQSAWRAFMVAGIVAVPPTIWIEAINSESGSSPPILLSILLLLLVFVTIVSLPAHPKGQALHDLLSRTVVVPDEDSK